MSDLPVDPYESTRTRILELLLVGPSRTPAAVAKTLGIGRELAKKTCQRMAADGELEKVGVGMYTAPDGDKMRLALNRIRRQGQRRGPRRDPDPELIASHLMFLRRRGLMESTIDQRRQHLRRLLRFLNEIGIEGLLETTPDLLIWYCDRPHSNAAKASTVSQVREFYRWAHEVADLITENPARKLVRPRQLQAIPRPIENDRLTRAFHQADYPVKAFLLLAAYCGLRAAEVAGLHRQDFDLESDPPQLLVRNGKGGRERVMPLPSHVVDAVAPLLPYSEYLFPRMDPPRGPISPHAVQRKANQFLRDIGIPNTFHSLRHWYGTNVYNTDHDMLLTQNLMGHASPTSTAIYTKVRTTKEAALVVEQLPDLVGG